MPIAACKTLQIDCRHLPERASNPSRGRMWGARMYRGPAELRSKLSMLYSEVPIYRPFLL
jgi:hypothetical protein